MEYMQRKVECMVVNGGSLMVDVIVNLAKLRSLSMG